MIVCDIPSGGQLCFSIRGCPFYLRPPHGLRVAGYCGEVLRCVEARDAEAVRAWLASAATRATADPLAVKAAQSFVQRPVYSC
jgi:hypothetical protein